MTDIKVTGFKNSLDFPQQLEPNNKSSKSNFDEVLKDAIGKISQVEKEVEKAVNELASKGDIVEAIIAMEKADMSFQLMVEIRNKLISAYEEISRMQI
ncbi:MAG: flagellar hook-basal body complex protein FliE [Deltaproteobacteria bacterium]|nr:Flagellar hook-basal body complex protein FliE [bacterium HR37]GIW46226.1 MAG: flagellar hook-basal body complex protein FliE [Deltaproteobacteria bacterium]